jgi:hypothetical protein
MLRNQVGISNDLASLLYCRSSAEIITSRMPSAEIITLSAALSGDNNFISARQLVGCHDSGVTLWHCQCSRVMSWFTDVWRKNIFLFDTVRIWEFSPMWTDFDKCHNLSKRNVKLILKVLSDFEPLRGSSNKKTLYSTRSFVNWAFFGTRGPLKRSFHSRFKMAHACQGRPNLHTKIRAKKDL